ncbi:hypothetical protein R1sor_001538 [Riccia sorocarpa]|uniref:Non-structural maintenance of chromosomes element 4 n=1 Tax=Riccia sorocarpa TaxID=122646 RepID=A0ABD3H0D7_9MARC
MSDGVRGQRSKRPRLEKPNGKDVVEQPETPTMDSHEQRRKLRSRYRDLQNSLADDKDELAQSDSCKFDKLFDQMESLHQLVNKPREQVADAELFLGITTGLLEVAKGARCKNGMSPSEFVGTLMHNFGGSKVNWNLLGMTTCGIFREAPGVLTMVGPMDIEVKQRKVQQRRTRDKITERTRVQEVEEGKGKEDSETDANMFVMFKILSEYPSGVEMGRLILNRNSFAQTIENLFCMSFLAKDGRAEITIRDGGVFVVARNAPSHEERGRGQGLIHNSQFVFRIDWKDWKFMKETIQEGTELMPHRGCGGEGAPAANRIRTPIRKTSRNRARETPGHDLQGEEDEGVTQPSDFSKSLNLLPHLVDL